MGKNCLLIIDPQNDFCDKKGSLFVPGADKDIKRLSKFIKKNKSNIDSIVVSLDTHNICDVAHPSFWVNENKKHPSEYTVITLDDFKNKKWMPFTHLVDGWIEEYLIELTKKGRYPLVIWPPHCLAHSWGWEIPNELKKAISLWEGKNRKVRIYEKGKSIFTENYSLFEAECPFPEDDSTFFNYEIADFVIGHDKIFVGGEARTHCVLNSIRSLVEHYGDKVVSKIVLLEDTTSNVPIDSAIKFADDFFAELEQKGMLIKKHGKRN